MAKAPPCPERTLNTPLPQQSSPSARDAESQWVAMEDRRRRSTAFEKMAKREDSDDVKVGITELPAGYFGKSRYFHYASCPASNDRELPKDFRNF